jgi:hypothetical protein
LCPTRRVPCRLPRVAERAHARIDPALFGDIQGSTDTAVVFHLALTFALEEDPVGARELAVGLIEQAARRHGVARAVRASFGVSHGRSLGAVRYATEGPARSLFASADVDSVRRLHPRQPALPTAQRGRRRDRLRAVLRPARCLARDPQGTAVTVRGGGVLDERPFSGLVAVDRPVRLAKRLRKLI